MASIVLTNMPDDLMRRLQKAADDDGRALQEQISFSLDRALQGRFPWYDVESQIAAWRMVAGQVGEDALAATMEAVRRRRCQAEVCL